VTLPCATRLHLNSITHLLIGTLPQQATLFHAPAAMASPSPIEAASSAAATLAMHTDDGDLPELRYGEYAVMTGWLQKKGKVVRHGSLFGIHKKTRLLKLRGSTLQCYKSEEDEFPDWEVGLQNAEIIGDVEHLQIEIKMSHRVEGFVAETHEDYVKWYSALVAASNKSVKTFYSFLSVIGQGHFGKVLLAKDRLTREKFAVKVIKKDSKTDVRNATLIQRELEILRLVNHKNIVRLYDLFDTVRADVYVWVVVQRVNFLRYIHKMYWERLTLAYISLLWLRAYGPVCYLFHL
jgi:hypothetical protein